MFKPNPLAVAVAFALPISLVAHSAGAALLEETVVTAQKREQSIQDVGIAITAFTGDQLDQLGWTNAQQVTAMAPGVTTIQPNGEANYSVAIRGVANSDFTTNVESPVALYVDEVYISQMSGAGFLLYDMDRVEILRGPQGTLFGRNATGGLVHYITKKPTQELDGYIMGTVGDYEQYKIEGAVGGGNEWIQGRFSGAYNDANGYINNQFPGKGKLNNADDQSYRAQVQFTPTQDLSLLLNVRHGEQNIDTGFFKYVSSVEPGKLTPGVPNPILDGYTDNTTNEYTGTYNNPGYNDLETDGYSATLNWSFDNFNLVSITDYSKVTRKYIEDSDASPVQAFNFFLNTDAEQWSQEIRLSGETDKFKWVTGFYYLGLELSDSNGAITDPFIGPVYDDIGIVRTEGSDAGLINPYDSNLDSYSVFGEVEYALTDKANLIVGARWIRDERDFKYSTNAVEFLDAFAKNFDGKSNTANQIELASYKGNRDDEEVSGRVVLDYTFNDDLMVYGSWNLGVRGGGYNAPIFPLSPPLDYDDNTMTYDPENLYAYEVGFKSTIWDGLARFNGAAYYYDYQDYQAFFITGIDTITFNTDATSAGAELELQASPIEGMDLLLGVGYIDIDVDLPNGDKVPSVVSPEWNLNGMLRYEWPMFGGYVAAQIDAVYVDTVYFALTGFETVKEDPYTITNVSLSYTTEDRRWLARAFVDNVADTAYLVQTFDLSGDVLGMTEQYYGRPQWWGVSLQYNFGG
jgi:iron complex outermembrane receptor protein